MSFCVSSAQAAQCTRFRSTATMLGALILSSWLTAESLAQSTVVIGGGGRPAVEVNLDALDRPRGQFSSTGRRLLMPGERGTEAVRLRFPGSVVGDSSAPAASRPTLQRPVSAPRPRAARQAAGPMPAVPPPKVTQRAVQPPVRAAAPASKPVPKAPPPVPKAAAPAPAKAVASRQIAPGSTPPARVPKLAAPLSPVAEAPPPTPKAPLAKAERVPVRNAVVQPKSSPPAVQPSRTERRVAALPRVPLPPDGGQILRIDFLGASTRLTPDAERRLGSLAATMMESDGRLQLKAYAGGTVETLSSARRLSLSRALAVRSFLIEQGIRSTRIDVRALGRAEDDGPPERVDIVLLTQ